MNIFIRNHAHMMEDYRRRAHQQWGERYDARTIPYCGLIVKEMRVRKIGAVEAARIFLGLLKPLKKDTEQVKAAIYSAALDVIEKGLANINPQKHKDVKVDTIDLSGLTEEQKREIIETQNGT